MVATDLIGFEENRTLPWRSLGEPTADSRSLKEGMLLSGLGNLVQLFPVYGIAEELEIPVWSDDSTELEPKVQKLPGEYVVSDENHFLVVRTSDKKVLGMVGNQYQPYQNWQAFKLAEALSQGSGAQYDTCGPLKGGKVLWVSMEYPEPLYIGGIDEVRRFLVIASSHDGSLALSAFRSNVRVTCMNTLNTALRGAKQIWKVKHSGDMNLKVEEIKETIAFSENYDKKFEIAMNDLIRQDFTKKQFEAMVKKLAPSKSRGDGGEQTQMALIGTLESSATIDDGFRYTKYGAFNAVAEYADWIRPRRNMTATDPAEQQLNGIWFGGDRDLKTKTLEILTSV